MFLIDFYKVLSKDSEGEAYNPYAAKTNGHWIEGKIGIDFLNEKFSGYETATEMKNATSSEGLKKFFDYLVEQGKLPE